MVASTMLKGGFSNRTLQYADVSSMTRTCAAISVMIRSPCNEDVHERGSRSDGAWQPLRAAGAGKESKGHGLAFARAATAANSSSPNAVPARPQPPSAASVSSPQVRPACVGSSETFETIRVISATSCFCPARWSTPGGVSTCTRTVRAAPAAAVFTALGGMRWMYAPVLFKCVGPALDALRLQQCEGQLFRELTVRMGRKEIGDGVEIDHRHAQLPSNPRAIAARSGAGQRLPAQACKCSAFAEPLERLELVLVDVERANPGLQRLARNAQYRRRSVGPGYPALRCRQRRLDLFPLAHAGIFGICIPLQPSHIDGEDVAVGQNHGPLNDVLQLTHVARPVIGRQQLERPSFNLLDPLAGQLRVAPHQVLDQQSDVVGTFTERREVDR